MDRSAPPRQIGSRLDAPHFGPKGQVFFRMSEGQALYAGVLADNGIGVGKVLPSPILEFQNVSPDGRFLVVTMEDPRVTPPPVRLLPLNGGAAITLCDLLCMPVWSPDGRYLSLQDNTSTRTAIVTLPPGKVVPRLTPELIRDPAGWAKMPGV